MAELQGTTAVVTGSSKGIGYGVALALAVAGADVVVCARSRDEVAAAVERLRDAGVGRVIGFSEAMMLDLRRDGIRVVAVLPGSVDTHFGDRSPSDENAWMLQPEDVARVVLDLLRFPPRALPSRIEIRPTAPPGKG